MLTALLTNKPRMQLKLGFSTAEAQAHTLMVTLNDKRLVLPLPDLSPRHVG